MDLSGYLFSAGDLVDNRFRIDRLLGLGGMGEVYLAEDLGSGRQVALKMLQPELLGNEKSLARFSREMKSTQAIDHPGVLKMHEYLQLPPPEDRQSRLPIPCLVMEYLEGETLADWMHERGTMDSVQARAVVSQIAAALAAAHGAGIVHRDLKPDNVFLVAEDTVPRSDDPSTWRVVLTDFGVARRRGPADSEVSGDSLTASNVVIGTPEFMAPELLELEEAIPASDLYALGLVAFELVTGSRPFEAEQPLKALFMRVREPAPSPLALVPDLDRDLATVIDRCLERQPKDRYSSAERIVELLSGEPGTASLPLPRSAPSWPRPARKHWVGAAVLAIMVLMVLLLVWMYAEPAAG